MGLWKLSTLRGPFDWVDVFLRCIGGRFTQL
jgi:hypothetical protein